MNCPVAIAHGNPMTSIQLPMSTAGKLPIHPFGVNGYNSNAMADRIREIRGTVEWCLRIPFRLFRSLAMTPPPIHDHDVPGHENEDRSDADAEFCHLIFRSPLPCSVHSILMIALAITIDPYRNPADIPTRHIVQTTNLTGFTLNRIGGLPAV